MVVKCGELTAEDVEDKFKALMNICSDSHTLPLRFVHACEALHDNSEIRLRVTWPGLENRIPTTTPKSTRETCVFAPLNACQQQGGLEIQSIEAVKDVLNRLFES